MLSKRLADLDARKGSRATGRGPDRIVEIYVHAVAQALDRSVAAFGSGDAAGLEQAPVGSALTTSRTQVVAAELSLRAAEQIPKLGGGSATSRTLDSDRHWRNIRTVLSQNPLLHKARVIGDFYLNGTTTQLEQGRVF